MVRRMAAVLAAIVVFSSGSAAADDAPQVRSVPVEGRTQHWLGDLCIVTGIALIATSFELQGHANARYDDYLAATDPPEISRLYEETVALDRWSSGTLIGGQAFVAGGLYLRFLRRPSPQRVAFSVGPSRCAVSYHF